MIRKNGKLKSKVCAEEEVLLSNGARVLNKQVINYFAGKRCNVTPEGRHMSCIKSIHLTRV